MHVLVTGGAGFIGSHIVDLLIMRDDRVTVVDNLSTGCKGNVNHRARFVMMDIRDEQLEEIFATDPPEAVIHQAAQISVSRSMEHPAEDARINIEGTIHLLELSRKYGVTRFLMASSAAVYGDPLEIPIEEDSRLHPYSPYGISKMAGEYYLSAYSKNFGLSNCALRYANVYGPRQIAKGEGGVVSIFCEKIIAGEQPCIQGDGEQTRDFIYVGDIARANLAALDSDETGVFNIGTQQETSVRELVRVMSSAAGQMVFPEYGPEREGDIRFSALHCGRAKRLLNWEALTPLQDGLKDTFCYYQQRVCEGDGHASKS